MAGLTRKTLIPFGNAGPTSSFGQFGSKELGSPQTSQDPTVIQQLSAWVDGWQTAVVAGDKAAYIEDMNGWCLVHSYMTAYCFQSGIPEWDNGTLYFTNSIVQQLGQIFLSLQGGVPGSGAGQSGNTPPTSASNAFWKWINPPEYVVGASATVNIVPKVSTLSPSNGVAGSVALSDSAISEDGTDVIIGLPLKFPDNTVQSTAATSVVTSQANLGPTGANTRTFSVNYHNTGSRPIFVAVTGGTGSNGVGIQSLCDTNPTPTTVVGQSYANGSGVSGFVFLFFIVLPGYYYRVISIFAASCQNWIEWS